MITNHRPRMPVIRFTASRQIPSSCRAKVTIISADNGGSLLAESVKKRWMFSSPGPLTKCSTTTWSVCCSIKAQSSRSGSVCGENRILPPSPSTGNGPCADGIRADTPRPVPARSRATVRWHLQHHQGSGSVHHRRLHAAPTPGGEIIDHKQLVQCQPLQNPVLSNRQ